MNDFPVRPDDPPRVQALHAVLDYILKAAKELHALPAFGFFCGADVRTGAVSIGNVFDLVSVPPILQNLTTARTMQLPQGGEGTVCCTAVALAFPFHLRVGVVREPRVAVISAEPGQPPDIDVYRIDLNPLAPGIYRDDRLTDTSPDHAQDLTLWGVVYPKPTPSSGLIVL